MNFDYLVLTPLNNNSMEILYSTVDSDLEKLILRKPDINLKTFDEKNELVIPFLEIQKYLFFYKVQTSKKTLIFCILSDSENYNYFFNEIPFIKFKSLQLSRYFEFSDEKKFKSEFKDWFKTYSKENNVNDYDYAEIVKTKDNLELLLFLIITGKRLLFISEVKEKFELLLPFMYSCSPHRFLTIAYLYDNETNVDQSDIIISNKQIKVENDYIVINLNKKSINYKNNNKLIVVDLLEKIGGCEKLQTSRLKSELRSFIIDVLDLLALFQNENTDVMKTNFIENTKKSVGSQTFELLLEIAKTINIEIESLISPFTKLEKKYSSFLSEF